MPNISITNNDLGSVILSEAVHRDDLLTLAGADTIAAGTILARDSVSGKLVLFVKGGVTNENGIPKVVLAYEVVAAGAGDVPIRAGIQGKYIKSRLVIDADGDATNVDNAVMDQLRDYGLISIDVQELNVLDNQ